MLFNLVLLYLVIFYSQVGSRIPVLGQIRIELIVGTVILIVIFVGKFNNKEKIDWTNKLNYAILFFFFALLLSIPFSYWPGHSVDIFIRILKFFSIYLMITFTVDTEEKLKKFIWVYLLMVFLIVGEPFLNVLRGTAVFDTHRGYDKLYGIPELWSHPNSLGGFAAANLPFLYYLFGVEKGFKKIWILLIAISSLTTICYTGSRTAYIGVLSITIALWFFGKNKLRNFIILSLLLGIAWTIMPKVYKEQFLTLRKADDVIAGTAEIDDSMVRRWDIIKQAYSIFLDRPITGVGIDAFPTARGKKFNDWAHTHNLYLQVLTEIGVIGVIAFSLLLYQIFKNLYNAKKTVENHLKENKWLYNMANAVTLFIIARLIVGMFGMDLYENYWWFAGGLSIAILKIAKDKTSHPQGEAS